MKKRILITLSLAILMVCAFALTVSAKCEAHDGTWTVTMGKDGYLGEITATYNCKNCSEVIKETISPLMLTLGYSYSEMSGGITQHYAADREAIARYEEITGEKVRFGAVAATRKNVEGNPLDANGNPVNAKVNAVDFTDTEYDVFDVIVNAIPEEYRGSVDIICCAYLIAGNDITYIENGVEKINASANSFEDVCEKVDNQVTEKPEIYEYQIVNGTKYRRLTMDELGLAEWSFWWSSRGTDIYTADKQSIGYKYYATSKFTKEDLPVGTIIKTNTSKGWYFRPEGWVGDTLNSDAQRPGEVKSKAEYVIEDSFWSKFTVRAFNITKNTELTGNNRMTAEQIYEIFAIYVPVSTAVADNTPPASDGSTTTPEQPPETPEPEQPPVTPDEPVTPPVDDTGKQDWAADGELKILCIGNSFSVDSMEYVYQIAKAAGIEKITLGNLYIGGCSLATHLSNAKDNKGAYTYYTNTNGSWKSTGGKKISDAVKSDDWDFISVQQVSGYSGVADSYDDLYALLDIVEPLNPSARLVWHMTWAYKTGSGHSDFGKYNKNQMTMYNAIVNAVQSKVLTDGRIEIVIPAGTAIQNARTSYYGDNFTRDGYHLSDYGRYIGGLTFVKALTGLSVDNITYKLDSMTDNNRLIAIDAVNKAWASPYAVTTSAYVTEPEIDVPDIPSVDGTSQIPEGYRQLTLEEMGWQAASYWNGKTFTNKPTDAFSQKYYATTKTFTINEIPIGSIIVLKQGEGWQYRPDGWGGSGSRPGNVTTETVIVNETWWKGYTTRGFNLSKTSGAKIHEMTPEEIYEVLAIYVPVEYNK